MSIARAFATLPVPRAEGRAVLCYEAGRLAELYQQGCLKILLPRGRREAVVVNTSGGITGGDRLALELRLGAKEHLTATTQAAERIYRSADGRARVTQQFHLGREARLNWLPQETILYNGAALERHLSVDLEAEAGFMGLESYVFGRAAHGEVLSALDLRDQWRIRRGGRLVHAEALRFTEMPVSPSTLAGVTAAAMLVLAAPGAAQKLEACRALFPPGLEAGASAPLPDLLLIRLLAGQAQALRRALVPLVTLLSNGPLPRVWQF